PPHTIVPQIPVVAVTGTNGKTTTSRMIAHVGRTAGKVVGWSNTDGVYLDGALVEAGDYSGPAAPAACSTSPVWSWPSPRPLAEASCSRASALPATTCRW